MGTLRPGSSFGELGALLGDRRTASVAASRASRLLRLDATGLQALFDRCPGFGWAFSRELAQGLKAALAVKNELQAEHGPETVVLDVPAIDRMREYTAAYYASALRTLVRQHRLIVDRNSRTTRHCCALPPRSAHDGTRCSTCHRPKHRPGSVFTPRSARLR